MLLSLLKLTEEHKLNESVLPFDPYFRLQNQTVDSIMSVNTNCVMFVYCI